MTPKYKETFEGKEFGLYTFSVPMMHEDWHTAEENGLTYLYFSADGNDYWDYDMIFVKNEDAELAKRWHEANPPW